MDVTLIDHWRARAIVDGQAYEVELAQSTQAIAVSPEYDAVRAAGRIPRREPTYLIKVRPDGSGLTWHAELIGEDEYSAGLTEERAELAVRAALNNRPSTWAFA